MFKDRFENEIDSHIDKRKICAIISANGSQIGGRLMPGYNTKQRRTLLAFLGQHPDELFSARQIADALKAEQISLSAVYRNLVQLEADDQIRRYTKSGTQEAFYEYIAADHCKDVVHMKCVKCGRTFHMTEQNAAMLAELLAQNEQFGLDRNSTVLYGTCSQCKES